MPNKVVKECFICLDRVEISTESWENESGKFRGVVICGFCRNIMDHGGVAIKCSNCLCYSYLPKDEAERYKKKHTKAGLPFYSQESMIITLGCPDCAIEGKTMAFHISGH